MKLSTEVPKFIVNPNRNLVEIVPQRKHKNAIFSSFFMITDDECNQELLKQG